MRGVRARDSSLRNVSVVILNEPHIVRKLQCKNILWGDFGLEGPGTPVGWALQQFDPWDGRQPGAKSFSKRRSEVKIFSCPKRNPGHLAGALTGSQSYGYKWVRPDSPRPGYSFTGLYILSRG
jgi:hypothetical protein